jgi:hypothetical protein
VSNAAARAGIAWTSVPRWSVPAPALPAAAAYLACWFGDAGGELATGLLAQASPGIPVTTAGFCERWCTASEQRLRALIEDCRSGVRIILAGPEVLVMQASAIARELGAACEELVLLAVEAAAGPAEYVTAPALRRVFCAACRASFSAVAALEEPATCPGCGMVLLIDHRFSRPHAAYFGWPSDVSARP